MILLGVAALTVPCALLGACWWGADVVFQPPKMLPHTIWPERYGLDYETFRFTSADGVPLVGWLIPAARATERTILLFHGWGDNKGDLLQRVHGLARTFNLVLIDSRNHGESGGALSTIGCLESLDAKAALDWLERNRPAWLGHLGVFGLSMGGAIAIWSAAHDERIKAIAVEAPFPSFNKVVGRFGYNRFRLPYFPFCWATLRIIRWRLGRDPEPYSPIYHIARLSPRPTLFVAGAEDTLMPLADVRDLYDAAGDPKELWVVAGATHGKCERTAGPEYRARLTEFFEKHL